MWKEYFDKQQTTKHTFHLTDEKSIETDFMHQVKIIPIVLKLAKIFTSM